MLIVLPNDLGKVRVAVSANRKVGGAVQRNRAKRVLRAGIEPMLGKILGGNDIVLIAKPGVDGKKAQDTGTAIIELLQKARLIERVR